MSDSPDASNSSRYFKLGLFVLLGVALVVTGVIVLGAGALFRRTIPAETLVYESVNGLDVGSAVKYRGVPIGKVTNIVFASVKYPEAASDRTPTTREVGRNSANRAGRDIRGILIEMALSEKAFPGESGERIKATAHQMISRGLRARVTPAGISGQSYVEFDILDPADNPPPPIAFKPDELYIPSAPSTLGQVLDAASEVASDLQKADLRKVIGHIDDLATQATAAVAEVKRTVAANRDNLTRTMAELPETAARLRATAARADAILNDPRVDKAIAGFSNAADAAPPAVADVRRLAHEAQQLIAGEADDIRSIINDLRRVASDASALTDDARANPSRLLFGKPPPPDPRPPQ